jgi:hypothetical protein
MVPLVEPHASRDVARHHRARGTGRARCAGSHRPARHRLGAGEARLNTGLYRAEKDGPLRARVSRQSRRGDARTVEIEIVLSATRAADSGQFRGRSPYYGSALRLLARVLRAVHVAMSRHVASVGAGGSSDAHFHLRTTKIVDRNKPRIEYS